VRLNDGGTRELVADQVFLNVGTVIPSVPGLEAARPLTHIEALELDYLPPHLIVLGGGYVGSYKTMWLASTALEAHGRTRCTGNPDLSQDYVRGQMSLHDGPIALADEQSQWVAWRSKLGANHITVGAVRHSQIR
jgi:hypothetical protein